MEISQVHTVCKNCVFAVNNNGEQTGCEFDRIRHYEKAGVNVIDVYDEDNNKFKIVDGRFCLFYRNYEFMEQYPKNKWKEIVAAQAHIPYHIILFFEEQNTLADLKKSLRLVKGQLYQPNFVTVVNKQYIKYSEEPDKYIKPSVLLEELQNRQLNRFSLKNIYDPAMTDRDIIDLVFDNTKNLPYPFYITFRAGFDIPATFIEEFESAILIQMKQIGVSLPVDDLNGMIVSRISHKKHAGNSFGVKLEDKILKFEDNGQNFIFNTKELCPSLT